VGGGDLGSGVLTVALFPACIRVFSDLLFIAYPLPKSRRGSCSSDVRTNMKNAKGLCLRLAHCSQKFLAAL
jgi:hypothetical protein